MPGPVVHLNATVQCIHGGSAQPTMLMPRVLVSGQPVVVTPGAYLVAGCAFPPPPSGNGPCVTATFMTAATRVLAGAVPVLLMDSQATCVPTGTPLMITATQTRVVAQ